MFQHPSALPLRVTTETAAGVAVELATAAAQTAQGVSLTAIAAGIGAPADAAWDGVAASATVISLLKAIALNTAPA